MLFLPLGLGSGMGKKYRSGSGMNIPDPISKRLDTTFELKILKIYDAYADLGSGIF